MILNFLDLDINDYSCHCDIGHDGIESAYFDFTDFVNISSADNLTLNRLQQLISYPFDKSFVQACKDGYYYQWFNNWASFSHSVGSESILRKNFSSSSLLNNTCGPVSVGDTSSLNGLVSDSWTFKKYIYTSLSGEGNYSYISCPVQFDGSLLLANFLLGYFNDSFNYRKFKFYVDMRQVVDFPDFNCFIKVLYHRYDWSNLDEYNEPYPKVLNTIVVSEFQIVDGDIYCISYSGNKYKINRSSESGTYPLLFDFYDFYYDRSHPYSPYEISVDDLVEHEFNVFKKNFGFEILIYGDDSMSQLDCECLTNAINSLNNRLDNFNKSFSEAFNKVPVSGQQVFGSGSVFKSNDLDNFDYYYLMDNKGKSCDSPLNVNFCPFTFSEVPIRINSIPALDVDIDSMPTTRLVTHLNSAVDISCICDELDAIDKGLVAEFTAQGVALTSIMTSINELARKFITGCGIPFAHAFSEAFNLTNCLGSVFKANDNNWSDEDTLAGILYKQLDYDYVLSSYRGSAINKSAFYSHIYANGVASIFNLPKLISNSLFDNVNPSSEFSVFKLHNSQYSISTMFKDIFSISKAQNVSSSHFYNDGNVLKLLNHACNANPNSLKFCEDVPLDIPAPEVTVTNNVPVPDVDVEVASPSVTVNNIVPEVPVIPDNIYINADGKTFLNNNNFK